MSKQNSSEKNNIGQLTIGNQWNAINIIALSQNNPLKAIAEFVENSIDAGAQNIILIRGKENGENFLRIIDDGQGIDDFAYVATHIGDSIKRKLKKEGRTGIQGEFGIGLLSFWTVGERLHMISRGPSGTVRAMDLVKGNPAYNIKSVPRLFDHPGTELTVAPILPGVKTLSWEKIQNYLASELRDRISRSAVKIRILDRMNKKELFVEPRKFKGRLLHDIPDLANPLGDIYCELYINDSSSENQLGLYKQGTRIFPSITKLDTFSKYPWTSPYLEGLIDASFLQLTPGTRDGIIQDSAFESFCITMEKLEEHLVPLIDEIKKTEEEKSSKAILKRISKALEDAVSLLPSNEYSWLEIIKTKRSTEHQTEIVSEQREEGIVIQEKIVEQKKDKQRELFRTAGPLHTAAISPTSVIIGVHEKKNLKIVGKDKNKTVIDSGLGVLWNIENGGGELSRTDSEYTEFRAPYEPCITIVRAVVSQGETTFVTEAMITVTKELIKKDATLDNGQESGHGLPGYTFAHSPGELWRSYYNKDNTLIVINSGHADFIYASKTSIRKLRYLAKLFTKELILANFWEEDKEKLVERVIELQMYMEENL